jgi:hypothetical protein
VDERAVKPGVLSVANSPLQTLRSKTDAKQHEAGRKKLRDRMNPDGFRPYMSWTAAKATRWAIRLAEREFTWPAPPAGLRAKMGRTLVRPILNGRNSQGGLSQSRSVAALALHHLVALLDQALAFAIFALGLLLDVRAFFIGHDGLQGQVRPLAPRHSRPDDRLIAQHGFGRMVDDATAGHSELIGSR